MLVCGYLIPQNKTYGGGKLKNSPVGDEVHEGLLFTNTNIFDKRKSRGYHFMCSVDARISTVNL